MSYPIYQIDSNWAEGNYLERDEDIGRLDKFWIVHPELGRSLVKIEDEIAPAWNEKISSEIAKRLNLAAASYEIGELVGWQEYPEGTRAIVSLDFKQPNLEYIQGVELLLQTDPEYYDYGVFEVLETLSQNQVRLPDNYQFPAGINDGADLFVGYLLLDSLIANNDRHDENWEIGLDERGVMSLAPVFDNGASFGTTLGALVDENYDPQRHMQNDFSAFGELHLETFKQAARIRPNAARVWLNQLAKIEPTELDGFLAQIPPERIKPEAQAFAQRLLEYNRTQLLSFRAELAPSSQDLDNLYRRYARDTDAQGLSETKGIAKSALAEGIEPEQVVKMLDRNNAAYRDLVARSGVSEAKKLIVRKATMELATSRRRQLDDGQTKSVRRSPKRS